MDVLKLIKLYERGVITRSTLMHLIIYESNRSLCGVSANWVAQIRKEVDRLPKTEEEWAKSVVIMDWCGSGTPATQEQIREIHKPRVKWWRDFFTYVDSDI